MLHFSESCDDDMPHLVTQVHTTQATVHEAQCTATIQQGVVAKGLAPAQQLVDSAYVGACSRNGQNRTLSRRHAPGVAGTYPVRPPYLGSSHSHQSDWSLSVTPGKHSGGQFFVFLAIL